MTLDTEELYEALSLVRGLMDCRVKPGNDRSETLANQFPT
jgi:hypothetical protein